MELEQGTQVDRYTVEAVLGEGGMAMVYRVRHASLGTHHALKVLTLSSRSVRERLLQEGRVQARLQHPNIVAVTDVVDVGGAPGLVMELVDGPSLEGLLESSRLSFEQVDALAADIIGAVAVAHDRGFLHRDLKPANIMLAIEGGRLVPKVTDFGLAKILEEREGAGRTRTGATMGTPQYMAPEQIRDAKSVGPAADVFALGAVLYEMLTGRRAFDGPDLLTIFTAIDAGRYVPPRDLVPDLPRRMELAVVGALQSDGDRRIQSCAELLAVWKGEIEPGALELPSPAGATVGPWDEGILSQARSLSRGSDAGPLSGGSAPPPVEAPAPPAPTFGTLDAGSAPSVPPMVRPAVRSVEPASVEPARSVELGPARWAGVLALLGMVGGGLGLAAIGLGGVLYLGLGERDHHPRRPDVTGEVAPAPPPVEVPPPVEAAEEPVPAPPVGKPVEAPVEKPVDALPKPPKPTPAPDPEPTPTVEPAPTPSASALDPSVTPDPGARAALVHELIPDPTATEALGKAMREDPAYEVRRAAWRAILTRWTKGIGSSEAHESLAVWQLRRGPDRNRAEAARLIARQGTNLEVFRRAVNADEVEVRKEAVEALVIRADARPEQRAEILDILRARQRIESVSTLTRRIDEIIDEL